MKILIHTLFYNNYNYGAILQAYALYHTLETWGHDCIELNYARGMTRKEWLGRRLRNAKEFVFEHKIFREKYNESRSGNEQGEKYREMFPKDPMKHLFDTFMKNNFRQTERYNASTIKKMSESYDVCITGGDQMWNPLWHDINFYLGFSDKKNIAYSCSVGKDVITDEDGGCILDGIKKIDRISVRETQLRDWLLMNGVVAERVCDPVFLISKEEWESFSVDYENIPDKYIFAYLLGDGKKIREQVRELANRLGLKLVMIPHVKRRFNPYDVGAADFEAVNVGPREFIGLIKDAAYVVTDSFHGTAFSIILEKPFASVSRFATGDKNALNSRILSVLEVYRLQEKLAQVDKLKDYTEEELSYFDWEKIRLIRGKEREDGLMYLKRELEI